MHQLKKVSGRLVNVGILDLPILRVHTEISVFVKGSPFCLRFCKNLRFFQNFRVYKKNRLKVFSESLIVQHFIPTKNINISIHVVQLSQTICTAPTRPTVRYLKTFECRFERYNLSVVLARNPRGWPILTDLLTRSSHNTL